MAAFVCFGLFHCEDRDKICLPSPPAPKGHTRQLRGLSVKMKRESGGSVEAGQAWLSPARPLKVHQEE